MRNFVKKLDQDWDYMHDTEFTFALPGFVLAVGSQENYAEDVTFISRAAVIVPVCRYGAPLESCDCSHRLPHTIEQAVLYMAARACFSWSTSAVLPWDSEEIGGLVTFRFEPMLLSLLDWSADWSPCESVWDESVMCNGFPWPP